MARSGLWEAYRSTPALDAVLCGMSQFSGPFGFMIKYDAARDEAFLHLTKKGWSVPAEATMAIEFRVDGRSVWRGRFSGTDRQEMIEALLTGDEGAGFIASFAYGRRFDVLFHSGDEAPWRGGLRGTLRVTRAFIECVATARGQAPADRPGERAAVRTQPYGAPDGRGPREPQPLAAPPGRRSTI